MSFLQSSSLRLKEGNILEREYLQDTGYTFTSPQTLALFQEDVRGMRLIGTYEFNKISDRHKTYLGLAMHQQLKIWKSEDDVPIYTFSFYAGTSTKEHKVFRAAWFDDFIQVDAETLSVILQFTRSKRRPSRKVSLFQGSTDRSSFGSGKI